MGFLSKVTKGIGKALGSVVSSSPLAGFFGDLSGKYQQDDANKMAMMAWNLSNDYNSPKKQVERLVEAGLNPYLVNLSGNTAGVPGLTGGNVQTGMQSIFSGVNNIIGTLQGKANLSNTYAQTQASTAAAGASAAQAHFVDSRTQGQDIANEFARKSAIADLDYKKAQTELAQAQRDKTSAEASIAQGEADIFGKVGGVKGAGTLGKGGSTLLKKGLQFTRAMLK